MPKHSRISLAKIRDLPPEYARLPNLDRTRQKQSPLTVSRQRAIASISHGMDRGPIAASSGLQSIHGMPPDLRSVLAFIAFSSVEQVRVSSRARRSVDPRHTARAGAGFGLHELLLGWRIRSLTARLIAADRSTGWHRLSKWCGLTSSASSGERATPGRFRDETPCTQSRRALIARIPDHPAVQAGRPGSRAARARRQRGRSSRRCEASW